MVGPKRERVRQQKKQRVTLKTGRVEDKKINKSYYKLCESCFYPLEQVLAAMLWTGRLLEMIIALCKIVWIKHGITRALIQILTFYIHSGFVSFVSLISYLLKCQTCINKN